MKKINIVKLIILSKANKKCTAKAISLEFEKVGGISYGTFYPALKKLTLDGLLKVSLYKDEKTYETTPKGRKEFLQHYNNLVLLQKALN